MTKPDDAPVPAPTVVDLGPEETTAVLAADARTISGRVLPWDEPGRTSAGELVFPPGSISVPQDISRVKLLMGHSPSGVPVGVAQSWESRPDGLYMTFQFGSSTAADDAIAQAQDNVIDSFSIEAMGIIKTGRTVSRSMLKAVALVPFPAFANARVAEVLAEHAETETADDVEDSPALPGDGEDDTDDDGTDAETVDPDAETEPTEHPAEGADPEQETPDMGNTATPRPSIVPSSIAPAGTEAQAARLDDVLDFIAAARDGEATEAHAALTDITRSGMTDAEAPKWLGELWAGVEYERVIVPLLATKPLTGMKMTGYRWGTKPGVAKYAGDKAEIPSKGATVESVEVNAQRWAGGNDIDRAFWDFNQTEILRAYWAAMNESYAMETDADAAAFLNANATVIADPATDFIRGIARAGLAVQRSTKTAATFALVHPDDVPGILDFADLDAPKFMDVVPVANPNRWTLTEEVDPGTAIVGTKSAVDFYELPGAPLRVEAEHLAHGGRDAAMFGYTAINLAKPGGVQKISIGAPVTV